MFVVICASCLAGGECAALLQKLQQEESHYLHLGWKGVYEFISQNVLYEEMTKNRGQHWVLKFKVQELKTALPSESPKQDHISQKIK